MVQSDAFNRYKSLIEGVDPTKRDSEFQRWRQTVERIPLETPPGLLKEWQRDRRLAERWYKEYRRVEKGSHAGCRGKGIFLLKQLEELQRTDLQGKAHFNEWYAAI